MLNQSVFEQGRQKFAQHYGEEPSVCSYAPGRVEVLGNHTDYNEGYVLSIAISRGTFFYARKVPAKSPGPVEQTECRIVAGDEMREARFSLDWPEPVPDPPWANYIVGVAAKLHRQGVGIEQPFEALFYGNVPLGAGLSSSAALEICTGLALCKLYALEVDKLELARIGQAAEHEFAGVRTGLLDQISSLYGKRNSLVLADFRTLQVETVPLGGDASFLICNTGVKHSLVESAYNERRASCEEAAGFFEQKLDHPVQSLRDVSWEEWRGLSGDMADVTARRASHIIGENRRVLEARALLERGRLAEFGKLMYASHESSRHDFENSCAELDFLVDAAKSDSRVLGARLSGGGFGGSIVALLCPRDVEQVGRALAAAYEGEFGHPCDVLEVEPSDGAHEVPL